MPKPIILLSNLPLPNEHHSGCWSHGFPIHKGLTDNSLNLATLYAHNFRITPNQEILSEEWQKLKNSIEQAGYTVLALPFPEELNQKHPHHDAVFVRDVGMQYKDMWIKARFSVHDRVPESDAWALYMSEKFNLHIIEPPQHAYIEFGEVYFVQTVESTYYFGGLARANKDGHDFARSILNPDTYILIESNGYHIDTVLAPIINKQNKLCAIIVAPSTITSESLQKIKNLNIPIIEVTKHDAFGDNGQGTYAVNALPLPGILINSHPFTTQGVTEKLEKLGISCISTPLTQFKHAGGSVHCLTNEFLI